MTWKEDNKSDLINHRIPDSEMAIPQNLRDNLGSCLTLYSQSMTFNIQSKGRRTK